MVISALAIAQRHPKGLACVTDRFYAEVAQFIYKRLKSEVSYLLDDNSLKRASITCALFFEDIFSGTHQMDVFTQWHKQTFGKPLPLYEANDPLEFITKQFQLVLWLAICSERHGNVINPENEALVLMTLRILSDMQRQGLWERMVSNDQLADYIYSEEVQTDIMEIKGVLIWLQHYSFLGYWLDLPEDDLISESIDTAFAYANDSQRTYGIDSVCAFARCTWPCSLRPQDIYARMIRFEMNDDNDAYAKDIADMEFKELAIYRKADESSDHYIMEDPQGERFAVLKSSFGPEPSLRDKPTHIIGTFVRFGEVYHLNGISSWVSFTHEQYKEYCINYQENERLHHAEGQYDAFIKKQGGQRIFFFSNFEELHKWLKKNHLVRNFIDIPEDDERIHKPLMLFFEPNGQFTLTNDIQGIKSPLNPYYDKDAAPICALKLIIDCQGCSPDCLRYLLDNNLLPDAALNHIKGPEHGRDIVQHNAEFLSRCFRRDIRW